MKKFIAILLSLLLMPLVIAQETTNEEAVVAQVAGTTPDSGLYALDVLFDDITIAMASGENKADARLKVADERAAEFTMMVKAKKNDAANKALDEHNKQMAKLNEETSKLSDAQKAAIQARVYRHIAVLEGVRAKVPEVAYKGIDNALANAQKPLLKIQGELPAELVKTDAELKEEVTKDLLEETGTNLEGTQTRTNAKADMVEKTKGKTSGMFAVYGFE